MCKCELVGRAMHTRGNRIPPALKHGAYSATAVLPGESQAEFDKLHQNLIAEFSPSGVLEDDIVTTMARLLWRKQNLTTLRIAALAQARCSKISDDVREMIYPVRVIDLPTEEKLMRAAEDQARKELGGIYELVELDEAANFDGLTNELDVKERLDAAIAKCLKQLLLVRGVKSISAAAPSASPMHLSGPPKAA
jgi:hypothetical protein